MKTYKIKYEITRHDFANAITFDVGVTAYDEADAIRIVKDDAYRLGAECRIIRCTEVEE